MSRCLHGVAFCLGLLFGAPCLATESMVAIFDSMIKQLRDVQGAMHKQTQAPTDEWQEELIAKTEPLLHAVNDLYRSGTQSGRTVSAYGVRMSINNLRGAQSPQQAVQSAEHLVEVLAFLRREYQLSGQLKIVPPAAEVSRDQGREIVQEILGRSEFQQTTKPHFFDSYVNRTIVRAIAWLQGLFDTTTMQKAGNVAYLALWAAYGLAAFILVYFVSKAWSPRRRIDQESESGAREGIELQSPETHCADAEAFAREGKFGDAMRAYFLMMLSALEQRNLVARNRTWTNWEYLRAFQSRVSDEALRGRMAQLNRLYDQIRYGGLDCDRDRFAGFRQDVDAFLSALPKGSA